MYPTGAEIRNLLPADDPPVSESECDTYVDEWVSLVKEAAGNPEDGSEENATSRRIVRRGAWADAMEQLMTVSGFMGDTEVIASTRTWAEEALERFDAQTSTVEEVEREAPIAIIEEW